MAGADKNPREQDPEADPGEEASLLNARSLVVAGVVLIALMVFVYLFAAGLMSVAIPEQARDGEAQPTRPPAFLAPGAPRLQVNPAQDLQALRSTERARLEGYAWISQEQGIARIPIERAMEIIAERGLPAATQLAESERVEADESGFPHPTPQPLQPPAGAQELIQPFSTVTISETQEVQASPQPTLTATPGSQGVINLVSYAGDPPPAQPLDAARFEQRLDAQVPLDTAFWDERGERVYLGDFTSRKPVVFLFAYYECPMLCNVVLENLTANLKALSFDAGEQFEVVVVSIDPGETPQIAAAKKTGSLQDYDRPGASDGWHFLTGEQEAIDRLAQAVGFHYAYDAQIDQYAHPAGLILLTPTGRVSRYLFGLDYTPTDLRLGLVEAAQGEIGSPIDRLFLTCYRYDPVRGKYTLLISNALQLAGLGTVITIGGFVLLSVLGERWKVLEER